MQEICIFQLRLRYQGLNKSCTTEPLIVTKLYLQFCQHCLPMAAAAAGSLLLSAHLLRTRNVGGFLTGFDIL